MRTLPQNLHMERVPKWPVGSYRNQLSCTLEFVPEIRKYSMEIADKIYRGCYKNKSIISIIERKLSGHFFINVYNIRINKKTIVMTSKCN